MLFASTNQCLILATSCASESTSSTCENLKHSLSKAPTNFFSLDTTSWETFIAYFFNLFLIRPRVSDKSNEASWSFFIATTGKALQDSKTGLFFKKWL